MADNQSPYNDAAYDISSVPSWKSPPQRGAYADNFKLTPRMKAGLGAGAVVLAATGMVAYSNYASDEANAQVRQAQVALEASKVELQRQQQEAAAAAAANQETQAQAARREAVQACVDKAASNDSFNTATAVTNCANAFPAVDSPGMSTTSDSVGSSKNSGQGPDVGLVVLGAVGAVLAVGWAKKRFARN